MRVFLRQIIFQNSFLKANNILGFANKALFILIFLCISTRSSELFSQPVEGVYFRDKDSFALTKRPYSEATIRVSNPCTGGYCIVHDQNGRLGIIDSLGNFIHNFDRRCTSIKLFKGVKEIYFALEIHNVYGGVNTLQRMNGDTILSTRGRIIYEGSTEGSDYFFVESSWNWHSGPRTNGNVLRWNGKTLDMVLQDIRVYILERHCASWLADDFFLHNMLLLEEKEGPVKIYNYFGERLFQNLDIQWVFETEVLEIVVRTPEGFVLMRPMQDNFKGDTFDFFEPIHEAHLVYRKHEKYGSYLRCNSYGYNGILMNLPPIFDSIKVIEGVFHAYQKDSIFTIAVYQNYFENRSKDSVETFPYRAVFGQAYLQCRVGAPKLIGSGGYFFDSYSDDGRYSDFKLTSMIPNAAIFQTSIGAQQLIRPGTKDSLMFNTLNVEAGIGWYSFYLYDNMWLGGWELSGGGITLEYRIPLTTGFGTASEFAGQSISKFYVNGRLEAAGGITILEAPFGLDFQLGYTTDFVHHYVRPGLGLSAGRLQLGGEGMFSVGESAQPRSSGAIYLRFILVAPN